MQYVNDDMDELLRRAAENYPLDTNSANWNKVLTALQNENGAPTSSEKNNKNKNGRFLWLLLLLPLGFICNQLYNPGSHTNSSTSKTNKAKQNSLPAHQPIGQPDNTNSDTKAPKPSETEYLTKSSDIHSNDQDIASRNSNSLKLSRVKASSNNAGNYGRPEKLFASDQLNTTSNAVYGSDASSAGLLVTRNYYPYIAYRQLQQPASVVPNRELKPFINSAVEKTKDIQVARRKKFYVGVMGGPDATTVKFQKVEDVGLNFGLLLGYQFNKKWSVESGAYLERKYYYSEGKYFNTSKIYMPANAWIEDLSGDCKMIEIPVAAKYNFATRKQSGWFGVVGLSSYILLQENYTYNYYYGTSGPVPHTKEYKNTSTYIFSHVSVSGGYTHRLGNFADLRVEPYLKLPVSGMGVGSMTLSSAGVQVGITKKF
jgi:hypothetical protein